MTNEFKWLIISAALALGVGTAFAFSCFCSAWSMAVFFFVVCILTSFAYEKRYLYIIAIFLLGMTVAWINEENRQDVLVRAIELNRSKPYETEFLIPDKINIVDCKDGKRRVSFISSIENVDVYVNFYFDKNDSIPQPGEVWRCAGWMGRSTKKDHFSQHSFFVRGRDTYACKIKESKSCSFNSIIRNVRAQFSERIAIGIIQMDEAIDLNRALLLGEKSNIDTNTRSSFVASGTAHLFAISGLHVFVISKFLIVILSFTGFPSRFRALLLLPLLWFYVALVGAAPSAVRAGLMASFYHLAPLFWRKSDSLAAWGQTFFVVLVFSPENLMNVGCQLSFAVMLGLLLWFRVSHELKNNIFKHLGATAVAWLFGLPIIAATFSVITPGGLAANLIAIPIASLSVFCSASGVALSYLSPIITSYPSALLNSIAAMLTTMMVGIARCVASIPCSNFLIEPWTLWECVFCYLLLGFVLYFIWKRSFVRECNFKQYKDFKGGPWV